MISMSGFIWTGSFDMTIALWDPTVRATSDDSIASRLTVQTFQLVQELSSAHRDGVRALIAPSGLSTEVWSGGMERDPDILVWQVDTFAV